MAKQNSHLISCNLKGGCCFYWSKEEWILFVHAFSRGGGRHDDLLVDKICNGPQLVVSTNER
jgi:hypothetical protein